MKRITHPDQLEIGKGYYIRVAVGNGDTRLLTCEYEDKIYAGPNTGQPNRNTMFFGNHMFCGSSSNNIYRNFKIYGPVEVPDFEALDVDSTVEKENASE